MKEFAAVLIAISLGFIAAVAILIDSTSGPQAIGTTMGTTTTSDPDDTLSRDEDAAPDEAAE